MRLHPGIALKRLQIIMMETFGMSRTAALTSIILVTAILLFAVFWFFHSAPPNTITISTGPADSAFQRIAQRYKEILARERIKLRILPSQGSLENLKRLLDPRTDVDIAFVQGGVAGDLPIEKLVSLGSIMYEPLVIFYRSSKPIPHLSGFAGKRLAVGTQGSGAQSLAMILLRQTGLSPAVQPNSSTWTLRPRQKPSSKVPSMQRS